MAEQGGTRTRSEPMDRLKAEAGGLVGALGDRAMSSLRGKVQGATGRITDYVEGGAGPGLMAAVTGAKKTAEGKGPVRSMLGAGMAGAKEKVKGLFGKGGGGKGGKKLKVTNIVESIDVGAPITLVYNQWTQFSDFPSFMKKVENVEQPEEVKTSWKAQVFWSHRTWEATIQEQVPDDKIIWRSKGEKGHVDGAVTFHELAPNLTRILVVLEYHPQGLFERTGNIWRAQGRRTRLELKHFRRHLMSEVLLDPDEVEGWRGTIKDGEVVEDHQSANGQSRDTRGRRGTREKDTGNQDNGDRENQEDDEDLGERNGRAQGRTRRREADDDDSGQSSGRSNGRRPSRSTSERSRRPAPRAQRSSRSSGSSEARPRRATRRSSTQGEESE
jgi:uncharacterized membrane protein